MEKTQGKKVIVLGMDGLDPKIIERLMTAGELPNFSQLQKTGSYSPFQTSNPTQSPGARSSLATGCNPGKHDDGDFQIRTGVYRGAPLEKRPRHRGEGKRYEPWPPHPG